MKCIYNIHFSKDISKSLSQTAILHVSTCEPSLNPKLERPPLVNASPEADHHSLCFFNGKCKNLSLYILLAV